MASQKRPPQKKKPLAGEAKGKQTYTHSNALTKYGKVSATEVKRKEKKSSEWKSA